MRLIENLLKMTVGKIPSEAFGLQNHNGSDNGVPAPNTHAHAVNMESTNQLFLLVLVLTYLVLLLFVGLFLYNQVLCKTVPAIKPLNNIWQLLGLAILFELIM